MARSTMPPHQILDRDIEFYKGTMYSCREEFEYGTVPQYRSKAQLLREAREQEEDCENVIEQDGVWVRVNRDGYDRAWHGPFADVEDAWAFAERVWDPAKTGFRLSDDLDGMSPAQGACAGSGARRALDTGEQRDGKVVCRVCGKKLRLMGAKRTGEVKIPHHNIPQTPAWIRRR